MIELLKVFFEIEISRLTEPAIKKIIRAWFRGSPKKARELINHLSIDKDVYSLTETPLLLSLLCIQYANDLNIPNRKTELYSRCIDALLRLWVKWSSKIGHRFVFIIKSAF